MSGRMGMELQPAHMTDEDKAFARRAIADYKLIRPSCSRGDLYRLISPFDKTGYASLMYVSPEKDHAAYFVYKLEQYHNMPRPAFRMAGARPAEEIPRRGAQPRRQAHSPRTARPSPGRS